VEKRVKGIKRICCYVVMVIGKILVVGKWKEGLKGLGKALEIRKN